MFPQTMFTLSLCVTPFFQIPLKIISSLCLKPRKYLAYLGWCIPGAEGSLTQQGHSTTPLDLDGDLDDRGLYYYATPAGTGLGQAVDLEVIKEWSTVPSESTDTRDYFRNQLLKRDACCVFTGFPPISVNGMHIIPYNRGSEWFRLIIENRPKYEEEVGDMTDINDIRNGVFVVDFVHTMFDLRHAVILKTPNHFLATTDIPQTNRPVEGSPAPATCVIRCIGRLPKPSDLFLHYNYGAAAVKCWGHGKEVLENRPNIPRPTPSRILHDRATAIQKRDAARRAREAGAASGAAGDRAQWDEDDVMLFFWGNSPAAVERRRKKEQEHSEHMEQWRQKVPETSS